MTRYAYILRWNPSEKLTDLIEDEIGRKPDSTGKAGTHHIAFIFNDTDVTGLQKQAILNRIKEEGPLVFFKIKGPIELPDEEI